MRWLTVRVPANSTRKEGPPSSPGQPGDPDAVLCALLRHERHAWEGSSGDAAVTGFLRAARLHGLVPLLDAEFREGGDAAGWPREIPLACLKTALVHAVHESAQRTEAVRVIEALVAGGVPPLVLKGSALACSHYADPSLRPRSDTDLLIPQAGRARADGVLESLGYAKGQAVAGELIAYQALWSRIDDSGVVHRFDVHWRINNSQVLARLFGYEEFAARSVPLPGLGHSARTLDPVDALLLACIHRAGHAFGAVHDESIARRGDDRLIWLYDIHLLAGRMAEAEFDALVQRAADKGIRAICLDGLQRSRECFGTTIPPRVLEALGRPGAPERSARLLSAGPARRFVIDFLALDHWRDRVRWLGELAFPDAGYMRWKYPDAPATPLPVLYLRRALSGLKRLVSGQREVT